MTRLLEVVARDRSIAYRRAGAGPPVVLLHGFTHDSRVWRPQLEVLADTFTVLAWDAPGAGGTTDPAEPHTIEEWADDLVGFLDGLGIDSVHLLGLSWGGLLAQVFYARHAQYVRSLVLADTYAGWRGSLGEDIADQRLAGALRDSALPPDEFVAQYLPAMFSPAPPPEAQAELRRIMADFHPAGFRLMAAALATADTRDLLTTIRVPTLLLWGDQDARSPLAVGRQLHGLIRGSRLAVLEGAGHISNLERPSAFNREVRDFWMSLRPARTSADGATRTC